jgi:macrolide-specific efflux system membrane fusion protein
LLAVSAAAFLACVSLGLTAWHRFPAESPQWVTAPVVVGDVEQTVLATGIIEPFKLINIGAQASGRIVAINVALGEQVAKGHLIAEIDPSTERNALEIAEAGLRQARAQRASRAAALNQAEKVLRRAEQTYSREATSLADYETAEANWKEAKADLAAQDAQIRQATLQADTARVTLGYTKVVAPIGGTVVAIVAPEGQTVNAIQVAPTIVKLADLDVMTVRAQISEADITHVHVGAHLYFTILSEPGHRYYSTLRAIEPGPDSIASDSPTVNSSPVSVVSSGAIYYNGLFEVPNPKGDLRPSMTAQVYIALNVAKGVLTIPAAALQEHTRDGQYVVTTVDSKGNAEKHSITVGINNNVTAEVRSGLSVRDIVVLGGQRFERRPF